MVNRSESCRIFIDLFKSGAAAGSHRAEMTLISILEV
jgi:hypothetical protein